jgi:hypothetical protein
MNEVKVRLDWRECDADLRFSAATTYEDFMKIGRGST